MKERLIVTGEYLFEGFDKAGAKVLEERFHNIETAGFYNALFNFLDYSGQAAETLNVTHIATGDGTSAAVEANTQLQNERFRKQITSKTKSAHQVVYKLSLLGDESNFTIREI